MTVTAMVIQLSTRGTVDSDNWFLRLSDRALPRSYHLLDYGWTPLSQNPCQKAAIFTPASSYQDTNRLRPGTAAGRQPVALRKRGASAPADRNFTLRGDKSFADDLNVGQGAVSSRVALLLRSAEANPSLPRFVRRIHLSRESCRLIACATGRGRLWGGIWLLRLRVSRVLVAPLMAAAGGSQVHSNRTGGWGNPAANRPAVPGKPLADSRGRPE